MSTGRVKLPKFKVITEREESTETLEGRLTPEGHVEYELFGAQVVTVEWKQSKSRFRHGKKTDNARKGRKK